MEPDYNDKAVEEKWCEERHGEVARYLSREGVRHGRIGEWPAWHFAPYVSIWAIESLRIPDSVGWWVVCGDMPCDYVSSEGLNHPREALRAIAHRWVDVAGYMEKGEEHPTVAIGPAEDCRELGSMLRSRAQILAEWADEDELWEDDANF